MDFRDIYRLTITNQLLNQYTNASNNMITSSIVFIAAMVYLWYEIQPSDIKKTWLNEFHTLMRHIYCIQTETHKRSMVYLKPHIITYSHEYSSEKQKRVQTSAKYRGFIEYLRRKCQMNVNEYYESMNYLRIKDCNERSMANNNILFVPGNSEFDLPNGIHCRVQYKPMEERIHDVEVYLTTFELSVEQPGKTTCIFEFLKTCEQDYLESRVNHDKQIGHKIFEYMGKDNDSDDEDYRDGKYRVYRFKSNKYLDKNVFFEGKSDMIQYVSQFINDETIQLEAQESYMRSGVTFKAGMLFHGIPGCGKSTTIKAILNLTKRHGVYLNLNRIKTCTEFSNIFRSGKINDIQYGLNELCFIIEDFDANHCSILKKRDTTDEPGFCMLNEELVNDEKDDAKDGETMETKIGEMFNKPSDKKWLSSLKNLDQKTRLGKLLKTVSSSVSPLDKQMDKSGDTLTLECVLNVLDGVIELHNAMFIFTTNHPDRIDPALLRPGRIDYRHEFKKASRQMLKDMFQFKFDMNAEEIGKYDFSGYKEESLTPAEIQSIMFLYKKENADKCFDALISKNE